MIKIEKKIIQSKPFFYLTKQINIGKKYKKIQVYLGKNIPKDLNGFYDKLQDKEIELVSGNVSKIFKLDKKISLDEYKKIETCRVEWQYRYLKLSEYQKELLWLKFAIQFIFESNAIEGSRLSKKEVEAIVRKKKIKKSIQRKEILEVVNSIKAFELIRGDEFKLNQLSIKKLHEITTKGLDIEKGYKKESIIVNNKETTPPKQVQKEIKDLLDWWNEKKKEKTHPLIMSVIFHQRFELIHPFTDGNGRVGRLLFNWMLLKSGYGVILFKNSSRRSYFSALDQADNGRFQKLYWQVIEVYKKTIKDFF
jgi:Fic family protein